MALRIPTTFDVNAIDLDWNERRIRDEFKLNITNWARFRYTINIGNNAVALSSPAGPVPERVKQAYRELAKSHYEVITSLGCARLSLDFADRGRRSNQLLFKKSYKDFYFHIGCLLDNLARLIYIVVDPQSAVATYKKGRRAGELIRHWVDWGELPRYRGYSRLKKSKDLKGIINVRNVFTHGWASPIVRDRDTGILNWPIAIRTRRNFYWPYDELGLMRRTYRKKMPVLDMMRNDFAFIERFQGRVFGKLVRDIRLFERHYNVEIR